MLLKGYIRVRLTRMVVLMATEGSLISSDIFGKVNGRTGKLMDTKEIIGKMDSFQQAYMMKINLFLARRIKMASLLRSTKTKKSV